MRAHIHLKVDGFRSLRGTTVSLQPGLNVFVGPNGSGKTNIVAALNFLSVFIHDGVYAALSNSGGAARVFSNEELSPDDRAALLSYEVNGCLPYVEPLSAANQQKRKQRWIQFVYKLALSLSKDTFTLSIWSESLKWSIVKTNGEVDVSRQIKSSALPRGANKFTNPYTREEAFAELEALSADFLDTLWEKGFSRRVNNSKSIRENALQGHSVFHWLKPMALTELRGVLDFLNFDRSFNISPEKIKAPEDIASKKQLENDGSGVVSALYASKTRKNSPRKNKRGIAAASEYDRIIGQFCRLNDHFEKVDIEANLQTGKLDCFAYLVRSPKPLQLPLSSLSDGAAKWLAMLTIIRLFSGSYSVEEPENYLHPAAQRLFVDILRDISSSQRRRFFIITTHSETVVNKMYASELNICDYDGNSTRVRKVSAPEKVESAINETGFGLGFFYVNERL